MTTAATDLRAAVGRPVPRSDSEVKLTGAAKFLADLDAPGAVHARLLRSTEAHARIVTIDATAALSMPGVVDVVTAADLKDFDATWGHHVRDRPILADGVVRFAGEIVAAVLAETQAQAETAASLVEVDYERLPAVVDVADAMAPDAIAVHSRPPRPGFACPPGATLRGGNDFFHHRIGFGDAEPATDDVVTVDREYRFPALYQYAMEPHAVIAHWDRDGSVHVRSSCQHPFLVRAELAVIFDIPTERVRVEVPFVGGGFGSKSYSKLEPVAVALARRAGRPVRLIGRVEDAMVTTRRHGMRCRMRTTARRDGRLIARSAEIWMDTGAYADNGPTVTTVAGIAAVGPYRWHRVDIDAACVYTHLPPAGSYRGFGGAHLQWIGESQVDELAGMLGLDGLGMRRANLLRRGDRFLPGLRPVDADLPGDLEALADALGWGKDRGRWQGMGLSVGLTPAGVSADSRARVELDGPGRVTVHVGSQEIGQGARSVHRQIAAEVLELPVERVTVAATDTAHTPYDRSTGASRSTTVAGLAVMRAAQALRDTVKARVAALAGVPVDALEYRQGQIVHNDRTWQLADLGPALGEGSAHEMAAGATPPALFWEVCMGGAEVTVDPRTGRVDVDRVVTVADVGRAINPDLVARQDEGCIMQAVGNAFFEELKFDEIGVLLNDSLLGYRIPALSDLPGSMRCLIVENEDGPGPFGARGCGEGAFGGLLGALVCAVADAGVPVTALPMTPDRVWRAIAGRS